MSFQPAYVRLISTHSCCTRADKDSSDSFLHNRTAVGVPVEDPFIIGRDAHHGYRPAVFHIRPTHRMAFATTDLGAASSMRILIMCQPPRASLR